MTPDERPANRSDYADPNEDAPVPWADNVLLLKVHDGFLLNFTQPRPDLPGLIVASVWIPVTLAGAIADTMRAHVQRVVDAAASGLLPDGDTDADGGG